MRTNLLSAVALVAALAAPVAAQAYSGDNWNYATDSWPQISANLPVATQMNYAQGPSLIMSDATSATPRQGPTVTQDDSGVVHYGSTNGAFLGRDSQY